MAYAPHDLGPDPSWANQMSDYSNQLYFHLGALAFAGVAALPRARHFQGR